MLGAEGESKKAKGVSECGWSGQSGRERARESERDRALMFPKEGERARDARRREWDKATVRGSTPGPHLSSRCGLHSCPTQREKKKKRKTEEVF